MNLAVFFSTDSSEGTTQKQKKNKYSVTKNKTFKSIL
jgi:hypothetical protein